MATSSKRVKKSQEQRNILEDLYEKGMNNYRQDNTQAREMLQSAVEKTGLEESQVKVILIK